MDLLQGLYNDCESDSDKEEEEQSNTTVGHITQKRPRSDDECEHPPKKKQKVQSEGDERWSVSRVESLLTFSILLNQNKQNRK
ncbi:MAG: hypothetical protein Q8M03_08315 [Legionella sp.]|nr:hypothetical protein [Legionella sp.]